MRGSPPSGMVAVLVFLLISALLSGVAEASHFRFGAMKWYKGAGSTASHYELKVDIHLAFRRTGVAGSRWIRNGDNNNEGDEFFTRWTKIEWGDGSREYVGPLTVLAGGVDANQDWSDSRATMTHMYRKSFVGECWRFGLRVRASGSSRETAGCACRARAWRSERSAERIPLRNELLAQLSSRGDQRGAVQSRATTRPAHPSLSRD